jgi:hypothetical protein
MSSQRLLVLFIGAFCALGFAVVVLRPIVESFTNTVAVLAAH